MIFADLPLARRLEFVALNCETDFANSHAVLQPEANIEVFAVAGGCAIFAGVGSPMSQATALGFDRPVTEADFDAVEEVYFRRGAACRIVVCPLTDASVLEVARLRGYHAVEFENSLVRNLAEDGPSISSSDMEVRLAWSDETNLYADVVGPSFTEDGTLTPELRVMMHALFGMRTSRAFLAIHHGEPAGGGALLFHDGVAMLAGAATRPEFRNRGVHTALFQARLTMARQLGCDLAVMGARPGSGSQRNAERKGFQVAYTKVVLERPPVSGK